MGLPNLNMKEKMKRMLVLVVKRPHRTNGVSNVCLFSKLDVLCDNIGRGMLWILLYQV